MRTMGPWFLVLLGLLGVGLTALLSGSGFSGGGGGGTGSAGSPAGPFYAVDGTRLLTSYSFGSSSTSGLYYSPPNNSLHLVAASSDAVAIGGTSGYFTLSPNFGVRWSTTVNNPDGVVDTGLNRSAAGVVEINNGTQGTLADFKARAITWGTEAQPACSAATRGLVVMVQGATGVKDSFAICAKDATDAYAYRTLY